MRNIVKAFSLAEAGIYEDSIFNEFSFKELILITRGVQRRKAKRLLIAISENIGRENTPVFGVDLSLGELLVAGAYCGRVIRGEDTQLVPLTNPLRVVMDKYGISIN